MAEEVQENLTIEDIVKSSVMDFRRGRRNIRIPKFISDLINEPDSQWQYMGYDYNTYDFIVSNKVDNRVIRVNLKAKEVIEFDGEKYRFLDPSKNEYLPFVPEENKHYNFKTKKWEYFNIATGQWTDKTSRKDAEAISDTVKMYYDVKQKAFKYFDNNGREAFYMPEKGIWGIHNKEKNIDTFINNADGKELVFDEESKKFKYKAPSEKKTKKANETESKEKTVEEKKEESKTSDDTKNNSQPEKTSKVEVPQGEKKTKTVTRKSFIEGLKYSNGPSNALIEPSKFTKLANWFRSKKEKLLSFFLKTKKQTKYYGNNFKDNMNLLFGKQNSVIDQIQDDTKQKAQNVEKQVKKEENKEKQKPQPQQNDNTKNEENKNNGQKTEEKNDKDKDKEKENKEKRDSIIYDIDASGRYIFRSKARRDKIMERKLKLAKLKSGLKFKDPKKSIAAIVAAVGLLAVGGAITVHQLTSSSSQSGNSSNSISEDKIKDDLNEQYGANIDGEIFFDSPSQYIGDTQEGIVNTEIVSATKDNVDEDVIVNLESKETRKENYSKGDVYIVPAGTVYTETSAKTGKTGTLKENTLVGVYNRAIVRKDANGKLTTILSTDGKSWEEFSKETGIPIEKINDMLASSENIEMIAMQQPNTKRDIKKTIGWVRADQAEELQQDDLER